MIYNLLPSEIIEAFGWTLVHSIWQISLLAIILGAVLVFIRPTLANIRYRIVFIFLLLAASTCGITFSKYYKRAASVEYKENRLIEMPANDKMAENIGIEKITPGTSTPETEGNGFLYRFGFWFQNNIPLFVTLYLLGIIMFFLRFLGSLMWLQYLKATARELSEDIQIRVFQLSRQIGLHRITEVRESIKAIVPAVVGYIKPVILVPAALIGNMAPESLEAILLHELAHIRYRDYLVNILQTILEVLFFYHPAFWWISSVLRQERENRCDDLAARNCESPEEYASVLLEAGEWNLGTVQSAASLFSKNKNQLLNRITRIIKLNEMKTNALSKMMAVLFIAISFTALAFTSRNIPEMPMVDKSSQQNAILFNQDTPLQEISQTDREAINKSEATESESKSTITQDDDDKMEMAVRKALVDSKQAWDDFRKLHPGLDTTTYLKEANLTGFDLQGYNLENMNLKESNLTNVNFTGANLSRANIKEAIVTGTVFENADCSNANMKELEFLNNNLKECNLKGANLKEADLTGVNLSKADLSGAYLSEATLDNINLEGAVYDKVTLFPPDFDPVSHGAVKK